MPGWVKDAVDEWTSAAGIFRGNNLPQNQQEGQSLGTWAHIKSDMECGQNGRPARWLTILAPHDLRRTCARLCHLAGGELEQIQFLPGHVSIQTTEKYLGCKQKLREAINDLIGLGAA